jgi:hypothetical protein
MPNHPDIDKLLRANPHIDRQQIEESMRLGAKLREFGHRKKGYNLAGPGERRRVGLEETRSDRRSVSLRAFKAPAEH